MFLTTLSVILTFESMTLKMSPYHVDVVRTVPSFLKIRSHILVSKSNRFTFGSDCTKVVNLVKCPQAVRETFTHACCTPVHACMRESFTDCLRAFYQIYNFGEVGAKGEPVRF